MPRTARILLDGGTYHVLTRGNNGQTVFQEDADFQRYLQLLSAGLEEHGLKLYHFALMPNHVHLVLEVGEATGLSRAMHELNLTYSWFYKRRYRYTGHLWQGRFKSLLIDRESYLLECGRYVELNPVRANLVLHPRDYPWTSYPVYAEAADNPLIAPNPLYEALSSTAAGRQARYREFIQDGIRRGVPIPITRYHFMGGSSAALRSLELQLGLPAVKRGRGRPRKTSVVAVSGK